MFRITMPLLKAKTTNLSHPRRYKVFKDKLLKKLEKVHSPQNQQAAILAIIMSALGLEGRWALKKRLKVLPLELQMDILDLWDPCDPYVQRLWRAVYLHSISSEGMESVSKKYEIHLEDLLFFWNHLDLETKHLIVQKASVTYLGFLSKPEVDSICEALWRYCAYLTSKHLTFLFKNDPGIERQDVIQELWLEAVKMIRLYEHLGDEKKIRNYVYKGVHNQMCKYIKEHTKAEKARVVRIYKPKPKKVCGNCAYKRKLWYHEKLKKNITCFGVADNEYPCEFYKKGKKIIVFEDTIPEYQATVLSLDRYEVDQNEKINLHGLISDGENLVDQTLGDAFIRTLVQKVPYKVQLFLEIIVDEAITTRFEKYLRDKWNTSIDSLIYIDSRGNKRVNYPDLAWFASQYVGLDLEEIKNIISNEIKGLCGQRGPLHQELTHSNNSY